MRWGFAAAHPLEVGVTGMWHERQPGEYRRDPVRAEREPTAVLRLQQSAGNRAVTRTIGLIVQRQHASWESRAQQARSRNDSATLFQLLREALPAHITLISRTSSDRYQPLPTINFDPALIDSSPEGSTVTPNSETPTAPTDPRAPVPQICVVLGRGALRSSPAYARAVLDHEWRHADHFRRSLELVAQWFRTGGGRPFDSWLAREQRAGRISLEEMLIARERAASGTTGTSIRVAITETYAPVEAFINDFRTLPLDMPEQQLFNQLSLLAERWFAPVDQEGRAMQREILSRFGAFRTRLDAAHRQAFDGYVGRHAPAGGAASNSGELFYQQLAAAIRR